MNSRKAVCKFCGQAFKSAQAVRAHLRWCEEYTRPEPNTEPDRLDAYEEEQPEAQPKGFNPVRFMRERVQEEEARLRLRELKSAHDELDREEQKSTEWQKRKERERELAETRARQEAGERKWREIEEKRRRQEKRAIIQRVKNRVLGRDADTHWRLSGIELTPGIKTDLLAEIEQELAGLPVEELPEAELATIAQGIVERRKLAELKAKKEQETQKQREWERRRQESAEQAQRDQQRNMLLSHADSYAREELDGEELSLPERWDILDRVKESVEQEIEDLKSKADIEALVDEILDEQLGGPPEPDENENGEED